MYFCIKCIFAQLNIFLWKMYALQKCIFASNAFVTFCVTKCTHQMHFGIKCTFASNAFVTFCFAEHFPLENVRVAKMHLMRTFCYTKCYKCIFATRTFSFGKCSAYILRSKMFSITFSKGKCSANQNVRKRAAQKTPNTAFLQTRILFFLIKIKY